jgi:excisionase family DNA binding protein
MSSPPEPPPKALYVRLPASEAERLDRAAFASKRPKRELVASLVARYLDPDTPDGVRALRRLTADPGRVVVELPDEGAVVGHHAFHPAEPSAVLTPEQAAELLQIEAATVIELAQAGELPARCLAGAWRLSRTALLAWLGGDDGDA